MSRTNTNNSPAAAAGGDQLHYGSDKLCFIFELISLCLALGVQLENVYFRETKYKIGQIQSTSFYNIS